MILAGVLFPVTTKLGSPLVWSATKVIVELCVDKSKASGAKVTVTEASLFGGDPGGIMIGKEVPVMVIFGSVVV